MATIKINRSEEWMNSARKYGIYIDNEKVGTISRNETKEFTVQPGRHKVRAKIDWCGSKHHDFEIKEGETTTLTIKGFKNSKWILAVIIVPMAYNVIIRHLISNSSNLLTGFVIGISIGAFLVFLYYLTLCRNSYLQIKRENKE